VAQREADLLVAEAWAHRVLAQSGISSVRSEVVDTEDRLFLQIERFDRIGLAGRRGAVALDAWEAESVGAGGSWSETAARLCEQSIIGEDTRNQIQFLELFGRLIGNSDMHLGNLSLLTDGVRAQRLAPVYDMLPMCYAPRHGEIQPRRLDLPEPHPSMATAWQAASEIALAFWREVAADERISDGFRAIAAEAGAEVAAWRTAAQRLPRVGRPGDASG
jgi:serine/threonine protein kinase HipA of HipAB toxin-antitoxin module